MGAAVTEGAYTLFVADFDNIDSAWSAYEALQAIDDRAAMAIDGVVVVTGEADGTLRIQKSTDHSTKRGVTWGAIGGVVLGAVFPPSILGSAAALGAAGAATGKARQLYNRSQLAAQLENSIIPGHSALVALVSDPGAEELRKALATANFIVESAVDRDAARAIRAAAGESPAGGAQGVS